MKLCQHEDCTGCGACMAACSQCAIIMRPDASGHIFPHIEEDRCVSCGQCGDVCPVNHPLPLNIPLAAYAVHAKADADREASSSGGAASMLAQAIIKNGGVLYACVQDNYRNIYHCRIDKLKDIGRIRGSKYMQSDLRTSYAECKSDLDAGLKVLFIGTPCQIGGLRAYLGRDFDNLYTVDLICHGVPSQLMFRDNIDILRTRTKFSEKVCGVFRRKKGGKVRFGMYLSDGGKLTYTKDYPNDYFISGFLKGIFFRPNCFDCQYAQSQRVADLTIGDFWGLGASGRSSMNVNKGVSLVMVNSEKGDDLFGMAKDYVLAEERPIEEAINGNAQLRHSFVKPTDYDEFHKCYQEHGYEEACRRHLDFYIKRNRIVMMNENYPWITLPFRAARKLLRPITNAVRGKK